MRYQLTDQDRRIKTIAIEEQFGIETSCHFLRLIFAGVFNAYPNLKIILGYYGECLPFGMYRMNDQSFLSAKCHGLRKTPVQ
jgi:predicted TIM-barrel fold metal-dependent hydrolase